MRARKRTLRAVRQVDAKLDTILERSLVMTAPLN